VDPAALSIRQTNSASPEVLNDEISGREMTQNLSSMTPRGALLSAGAAAPTPSFAATAAPAITNPIEGNKTMAYVTTKDGVEIFYKDWGP
jgi:hypothetical protein